MRYLFPLLIAAAILSMLILQWKRAPQLRADEPSAAKPTPTTIPANLKQASFSAGCFWGVEEAFRHVKGVIYTSAGYEGGHTDHPTYQDVCTDLTGYAETVLITYDPAQISYAEILDTFWTIHDPTTLNSQGPDTGTQYRSIIFFSSPEQEQTARDSLKEVEDSHIFKGKIVTEIIPAAKFYTAEEYHQQYYAKQGTGETCHNGIAVVHTQLAKQAAEKRPPATQPATTSN